MKKLKVRLVSSMFSSSLEMTIVAMMGHLYNWYFPGWGTYVMLYAAVCAINYLSICMAEAVPEKVHGT
jgi:hypothetical protein